MRDIFCMTDIHGVRPLFDAIMEYCHEQDPDATIIVLGDACDRGADGYSIMRELLDNPYVIYLKGNHEDMFVKAAYEIKEKFNFQNSNRKEVRRVLHSTLVFDYRYAEIQDSIYNGGIDTLTDWVMDGMPMDIVERIENLPLTFTYEKCDFCHAAGIYRTFSEASDMEYEGKPVYEHTALSLLWSRTALEAPWEPNRTVVFGHTPTPILPQFTNIKFDNKWEVMPVRIGAKLDMDTGAFFTGKAYVLNVLTMRAQGFRLKDDMVEKIEVIQF